MPNYRQTMQRTAIQEVITQSEKPLSPEEILTVAKRQVEGIGIATVYREIKRLLADQLIILVQLPGDTPRYEKAGKHHHHHFKCLECNGVFDIEGCNGELAYTLPAGFEHFFHEVTIYGHCGKCRAALPSLKAIS